MRRRQRVKQLTIHRRGGARPGAGRKPNGTKAMVSHRARARVSRHALVLVTLRMRAGLPSLRRVAAREALLHAFEAALERGLVRIAQYSIQSNHLHLIVESSSARDLARGMQGLAVRIARALNRLWNRRGHVFADRYHSRGLATPREVRHALAYVLNNARKHGCAVSDVDPYSSGASFDGWRVPGKRVARREALEPPAPLAAARSWLLRSGWRRHGLIDWAEIPGR